MVGEDDNTFKSVRGAILERFRKERLQEYDNYSVELAELAFEQRPLSKDEYISEAKDIDTDFYNYNDDINKDLILEKIYRDISKYDEAIDSVENYRLYVSDIESFEKVEDISRKGIELDSPLDIPEADIKTHIRDIIGEPLDQTDWGGEINDLFTSAVILNGERVDTAFMLKGPSAGRVMQISDAGKRGDQIIRLFESPAKLFVIQSNSKLNDRLIGHIKEQVRKEEAKYCIIDGTDTYRLLKAYRKLEGYPDYADK